MPETAYVFRERDEGAFRNVLLPGLHHLDLELCGGHLQRGRHGRIPVGRSHGGQVWQVRALNDPQCVGPRLTGIVMAELLRSWAMNQKVVSSIPGRAK